MDAVKVVDVECNLKYNLLIRRKLDYTKNLFSIKSIYQINTIY